MSADQNKFFSKIVSFGTTSAFAPATIDTARYLNPPAAPLPLPYSLTGVPSATGPYPPLSVINSDQVLYVNSLESGVFSTNLVQGASSTVIVTLMNTLGITTTGSSITFNLYLASDATLTFDFATLVSHTSNLGSVTYVPSPTGNPPVGGGYVSVTFTTVVYHASNPSLRVTVTYP